MKKLLAILTAVLAAGAIQTSAIAADKQKVVYHVNGGDAKQNLAAMRNIQNHINAVCAKGEDCTKKLDLRVVMHGDGLNLVKEAKSNKELSSSIDKLKLQGVAFNVCANTIKGKKYDSKKDLYDVSDKDIVPSGVAELAILQSQGFAYIKP
jgi:intracellular sulfur oxidation DsrE/DsrF family protein